MTNQQYEEALNWLFAQLPNYQTDGKNAYKPGFDNILKLCDLFGNPQKNLQMIHIGGTNGKGSTTNMLASVLQECGYKIGLYNSPHLIDFTERVKINGVNCDKKFVYGFIQKLKNLPEDIKPSFFEFTTVMAFEYFAQNKVDFALIEVGLGGRLDSTNIITPILTAITNVALDHQDLLGETLEEIAAEKAGIIKFEIPIVSGEESAAIKNILKNKATKEKSPFIDATEISSDLESDLQGNYQKKNIRVVLGLIQELNKQGLNISTENIINGLLQVQKNTNFLGRWFIFSKKPPIICDTAHNLAGLSLVFDQLNAIKSFKHMILGFVAEKKIEDVLKILPKNSIYYFVKPDNNRGRNPTEYEHLLKKEKIKYKIFSKIQDAYLFARQELKKDDIIFIGGSNFVVGEFLQNNLEK